MDKNQPIDPRKTIFVGGVPRPLRSQELAEIMEDKFGSVCYAGIDVDPDLKYPKGKLFDPKGIIFVCPQLYIVHTILSDSSKPIRFPLFHDLFNSS